MTVITKGLTAAREVHDRNRQYWKQIFKDCPHSREIEAMPHENAEDAGASFWGAVGLGLINEDGILLCNCEDERDGP